MIRNKLPFPEGIIAFHVAPWTPSVSLNLEGQKTKDHRFRLDELDRVARPRKRVRRDLVKRAVQYILHAWTAR